MYQGCHWTVCIHLIIQTIQKAAECNRSVLSARRAHFYRASIDCCSHQWCMRCQKHTYAVDVRENDLNLTHTMNTTCAAECVNSSFGFLLFFMSLMKNNKEYSNEWALPWTLPLPHSVDLCRFTLIGWQPAAFAKSLIHQTETAAAGKGKSGELQFWYKKGIVFSELSFGFLLLNWWTDHCRSKTFLLIISSWLI